MIVTIIQGLWKEGSKKKNYSEGTCGHSVVKGRQQIFFLNYEGACDHVAL
jgi:hypothetical protein